MVIAGCFYDLLSTGRLPNWVTQLWTLNTTGPDQVFIVFISNESNLIVRRISYSSSESITEILPLIVQFYKVHDRISPSKRAEKIDIFIPVWIDSGSTKEYSFLR